MWLRYNLDIKIVSIVLGIGGFFPYRMIFRIVEPSYLFIYLFCSECYYSIAIIKNEKGMLVFSKVSLNCLRKTISYK